MFDQSYSEQLNLEHFIEKNVLPCYAYVNKEINYHDNNGNYKYKDKDKCLSAEIGKANESECLEKTQKENLYLMKVFECDCIFAKSYSSKFEQMLINRRNSFTQSDMDYFTWASNYLTLSQDRNNMLSEEVVIPLCYQGLFEMFSANSNKLGGILDHETDIITLASRFTNPACYYVAKELNVYEIYCEKSSKIISKYLNSLNLLGKTEKQPIRYHRRWSKLPVGTICKAIRVANMDCFNDNSSYLNMCQAIFCCKKNKNKSEMVIEFQVVRNFDELMKPDENLPSKIDETRQQIYTKKLNKKLFEQSYFIPVDVDNPNKSIDLIPIAPVNKNVIVKNSLQTIKNFENIDLIKKVNSNLEVKLFAEDLFPVLKEMQSFSKSDPCLNIELCKLNMKLEMNKFSSILEAYESKRESKILVGYNLDSQQLFFSPVSKVDPKITFNRLNECHISENSIMQDFQKKLNLINKLCNAKVKAFNSELNKLEMFSENIIRDSETKNAPCLVKKPTVSHFSDLIDCDFKKGSISKSFRQVSRFCVEKTSEQNKAKLLTGQKLTRTKELNLPPFKLKKYHSQSDNMNIIVNEHILNQINEKLPHLKNLSDDQHLNHSVFKSTFETLKSLEFIGKKNIDTNDSICPSRVSGNQSKKVQSTNLTRTRSRSLPSIFIIFEPISYCKKNFL